MKRLIVLTSLLACVLISFAKDEFTLKGSVRDRATSSYIINAKIECINSVDSVVGEAWAISYDYDYHRDATEQKAIFWMDIPRNKGKYTLRFTHEEYDTITAPLDLTNIGAREYDREIGVFYMDRPKVTQLKDVEVTASKIMFYNRGDTVVYNADAFQLAEGSMLDALIEQLPGVELRDGGQIYVNGKFVQSLLLNGKDFFKGDNKLMLDNLAAYTVKNIEVYKKQTERAKFLGLEDDSNKEYVMDVKLKKEYIGGWNINTEAAGGTEDRYLARLFAMHFTALSQFTVIGNVNNLNDDSRPTAEDEWDPENMDDGERRYQHYGLDYSIENDLASRKASGNVVFTSERSHNIMEGQTTNFLPDRNTYNTSFNDVLRRNYNFSTRHSLYMQTSAVALKLTPDFSWRHGRQNSFGQSQTSFDESQSNYINNSLSEAFGSNDGLNLGCRFSATVKVPKTSDAVDIYGNIRYQSDKNMSESYNIIKYGTSEVPPDARRQKNDTDPTHNTGFTIGADYNFVLNNSFNATLRYNYTGDRQTNTSSFYLGRLDASYTGDYTLENLYGVKMSFDPTNSNVSEERSDQHEISTRVSWKPGKCWEFSANIPLTFIDKRLVYRQDGNEYNSSFNNMMFDELYVSLDYTKSDDDRGFTSIRTSYNRYMRTPELSSLITIPNTRDPLTQYLGNPDLKPSVTNQYYIIFQKMNRHNLTFYCYAMLSQIDNSITSGYTFDSTTGKRTYKSYNVDGNLHAYTSAYLSWYEGKHNWDISLQVSYNHTRSHSMIGSNSQEPQLVTMYSNQFTPTFRIAKYFGEGHKKYIRITASPIFRHNKSTDVNAVNLNPKEAKYSVAGKYEFPFGWSLSTSLNLNMRSGYNDPQMNRNEWIWNGRITKSLLRGKLMASIVAYDLLHQNSNYVYYVNPQMQTEYHTNTIPRYMLLDLQYKINLQPKKKIAQTTRYY